MDQIGILEYAIPIDVADLPEALLAPLANRPYMPPLERRKGDEATIEQRQVLRSLYPDYRPQRFGAFRDRYNREAEQARFGLWMKRRHVKRIEPETNEEPGHAQQ